MHQFKYQSNCQAKSLFLPFATDTNQIDLVGHGGLSRHYLSQDCNNDRRNHIIKK